MFRSIYSFIFVAITATSMIAIHKIAETLPPALTLFLGTVVAIFIFHLINFYEIKTIYRQAFTQPKRWFFILTAITVIWLCTIYGSTYLLPDLFILLFFVSATIIGLLSESFHTKLKSIKRATQLSALGLLSVTLVILFLHARDERAWNNPLFYSGVLLGLAGGSANFFYSRQSYFFSQETRLTATQILAIRFWFILFISPFLFSLQAFQFLNARIFLSIIWISLVSLVLPVFFYLKGVLLIGPEKNSMICGLIPVITYLFTVALGEPVRFSLLGLNLLISFFIAWPYIVRLKNKNQLD